MKETAVKGTRLVLDVHCISSLLFELPLLEQNVHQLSSQSFADGPRDGVSNLAMHLASFSTEHQRRKRAVYRFDSIVQSNEGKVVRKPLRPS